MPDIDNIFGSPTIDVSTLDTQSIDEGSENKGTDQNETPGDSGQGENQNTDGSNEGSGEQNQSSQPNTQSEGQPQQLILGKFKTEADVSKSFNSLARKIEAETGQPYGSIKHGESVADDYQNLQAYYTTLRQTKKQESPQQKQIAEKEIADEEAYEKQLTAWYEDMVLTDPLRANAVLSEYLAEKKLKAYKSEQEKLIAPIIQERQNSTKVKTIESKFPDIAEYRDDIQIEIQKIIDTDPAILDDPNSDQILVERAYYNAKINSLQSKLNSAFENGKQFASKTNQEKKTLGNEKPGSKQETEKDLPPGLNIMPGGDGIFF